MRLSAKFYTVPQSQETSKFPSQRLSYPITDNFTKFLPLSICLNKFSMHFSCRIECDQPRASKLSPKKVMDQKSQTRNENFRFLKPKFNYFQLIINLFKYMYLKDFTAESNAINREVPR